jgi:hypothetical protein
LPVSNSFVDGDNLGHVNSPDSSAGQRRPYCCPSTGVTCDPHPYWPYSKSDGSTALSAQIISLHAQVILCSQEIHQETSLGLEHLQTRICTTIAVVLQTLPTPRTPARAHISSSSLQACANLPQVPAVCDHALTSISGLLLLKGFHFLIRMLWLAETEENKWQWLSVDTVTPEQCMLEILKRDASSGVMEEAQDGVPAPDWQGCSHRYACERRSHTSLRDLVEIGAEISIFVEFSTGSFCGDNWHMIQGCLATVWHTDVALAFPRRRFHLPLQPPLQSERHSACFQVRDRISSALGLQVGNH